MITSVKQLSPDVVEIKRAHMYRDFYNSTPYPEEVIIIDQSKMSSQDSTSGGGGVVFESYLETGNFKQELTRLHSLGLLLKRQHVETESHKAFQ